MWSSAFLRQLDYIFQLAMNTKRKGKAMFETHNQKTKKIGNKLDSVISIGDAQPRKEGHMNL